MVVHTRYYHWLDPAINWTDYNQITMINETQQNIVIFTINVFAVQLAQIEEFMFQNVAYQPTVYKTGIVGINSAFHKLHKQLFLVLLHCT